MVVRFSANGQTILSPETGLKPAHLDVFRNKIELVFNRAIFGEKPSPQDSKRSGRVHLDDSLLERFIELSSKCRDEEAEDLVYFILDIYQFCGVQVALAELDIDQVSHLPAGSLVLMNSWRWTSRLSWRIWRSCEGK